MIVYSKLVRFNLKVLNKKKSGKRLTYKILSSSKNFKDRFELKNSFKLIFKSLELRSFSNFENFIF